MPIVNPRAIAFSSLYNGFKNNDYQTGTITVSGTVAGGAVANFTTNIPINREGAVTQLYFTTNRTSTGSLFVPGETYFLPSLIDYPDGIESALPAPYTVVFLTSYTVSSIIITAQIVNPYPGTLSNIAATYTIQAFTFVAPWVA